MPDKVKILKIKDLDDCTEEGCIAREVILNEPVTKDLIYFLGKEGEMKYIPDLPVPFFKVVLTGIYILKGVEGKNAIRLTAKIDKMKEAQKYFEKYIKGY